MMVVCLFPLIPARRLVWVLLFLSFEWLLLVSKWSLFQPQVVAECVSCRVHVWGCCRGMIREVCSEINLFVSMAVCLLFVRPSSRPLPKADTSLGMN